MSVGVICLTPENREKPWLLFEAGALSKTLGENTRVCPYLFGGLAYEDVRIPLGMFQSTKAEKEDTRKLVKSVNKSLAGPLSEDRLDTVFERMWPELDAKLMLVQKDLATDVKKREPGDMLTEVLELSRGLQGRVEKMVDTMAEMQMSQRMLMAAQPAYNFQLTPAALSPKATWERPGFGNLVPWATASPFSEPGNRFTEEEWKSLGEVLKVNGPEALAEQIRRFDLLRKATDANEPPDPDKKKK